MRRSLLLLVPAAAALAAPAVAVPGARTAEVRYTGHGGVAGEFAGDIDINGTHVGTALVHTRRGESRIDQIVVTDDAGLPVAFQVGQDKDDDGRYEWKTDTYCGRTTGPLKIQTQRADVYVFLTSGPCGTGVAAPTTGTVQARIS